MAESYLEVTAGSGTKNHTYNRTIGGNSVHDHVVIPGEHYLASYFIIAEAVSVTTANDHTLQIMAGSSLNVAIRRIRIEQQGNVTSAGHATFQIMRLTTAGSGGTSITPAKASTADAASGATAQTNPSSKGTESTILYRGALLLRSSVATGGAAEDLIEWESHPGTKGIWIAAGTSNGIAIKQITANSPATVNVSVEFVETNFT